MLLKPKGQEEGGIFRTQHAVLGGTPQLSTATHANTTHALAPLLQPPSLLCWSLPNAIRSQRSRKLFDADPVGQPPRHRGRRMASGRDGEWKVVSERQMQPASWELPLGVCILSRKILSKKLGLLLKAVLFLSLKC